MTAKCKLHGFMAVGMPRPFECHLWMAPVCGHIFRYFPEQIAHIPEIFCWFRRNLVIKDEISIQAKKQRLHCDHVQRCFISIHSNRFWNVTSYLLTNHFRLLILSMFYIFFQRAKAKKLTRYCHWLRNYTHKGCVNTSNARTLSEWMINESNWIFCLLFEMNASAFAFATSMANQSIILSLTKWGFFILFFNCLLKLSFKIHTVYQVRVAIFCEKIESCKGKKKTKSV